MLKKLFSRFAFVALAIILIFTLDVLVIVGLFWLLSAWLSELYPAAAPWITFGMTALGWIVTFLTVLHAANRDMVPETKIPGSCASSFSMCSVSPSTLCSPLTAPTSACRRRRSS